MVGLGQQVGHSRQCLTARNHLSTLLPPTWRRVGLRSHDQHPACDKSSDVWPVGDCWRPHGSRMLRLITRLATCTDRRRPVERGLSGDSWTPRPPCRACSTCQCRLAGNTSDGSVEVGQRARRFMMEPGAALAPGGGFELVENDVVDEFEAVDAVRSRIAVSGPLRGRPASSVVEAHRRGRGCVRPATRSPGRRTPRCPAGAVSNPAPGTNRTVIE
jgi:hypothetical protein